MSTKISKPENLAVGERVRLARKKAGLTQVELGKRVGLAHPSISQGENGQTKFEDSTLRSLAQALQDDFGLAWLSEFSKPKFFPIQVEGEVRAGAPIEFFQDSEKPVFHFPPEVVRSGCAMSALRVRGDSMTDEGIFDGDILVVSRGCRAETGQIVIAFVPDDGITVKRFYEDRIKMIPRGMS